MAVNFPQGLGEIVYEYDWYTGSQVLVYFEEVCLDDCVRIAWGVRQNKTPIYGYASQYWNGLADGVVMVGGSLWIGFKEAAYIPVILSHIADRSIGDAGSAHNTPGMNPAGALRPFGIGLGLEDVAATWRSIGSPNGQGANWTGQTSRANIERLMEAQAADPTNWEVQAELQRLVMGLGAMNDREFEDIAETFEDANWYGGGDSNSAGRNQAASGNLAEGTNGGLISHRRADQYPPIDIIVTFGDINSQNANHTSHRLTDVTFVDTQYGPIASSGEPIYVQYDFIGRNVM